MSFSGYLDISQSSAGQTGHCSLSFDSVSLCLCLCLSCDSVAAKLLSHSAWKSVPPNLLQEAAGRTAAAAPIPWALWIDKR